MALTRAKAIAAMKAAGTQGDKAAFTRLYIENRISRAVADQAWRDGVNFARFIADRDAAKASA